MRAIKHVLTERFYTWEDAVKVAETDPEVDLTGTGPAFTPSNFLEDSDVAATEGEQQAAEATGEAIEKAEPAAAATPEPASIPSSKQPTDTPRL
jgi:large subunit ribosomal protein L47